MHSSDPPALPPPTLPPSAASAGSGAADQAATLPMSSALPGQDPAAQALPAPPANAAPPAAMMPVYTTSYHRDIRPVIDGACLSCHAAGNVSPFPLDAWPQVQSVAARVVQAVSSGAMPPWPADDSCHTLRDSRALTQETRDLFARWQGEGFPEGNPLDYKKAQPKAAVAMMDMGEPSWTMGALTGYTPPDKKEMSRCFLTEHVFDRDTFIKAIDIVPDQHAEVAQVTVHRLTAMQRDQVSPFDLVSFSTPGYDCTIGLLAGFPEIMFSWRPGAERVVFDEGDAAYLEPGSSIMLEVRYNTLFLPNDSEPTPDVTKVQFWMSPEGDLPDRVIYRRDLQLPLTLPAGESNVVIEAVPTMMDVAKVGPTGLFIPGEIVGMTPHAQQLAKTMSSSLIKENGARECLVRVPNWQASWQLDYMFPDAVPYTAMDKVHLQCVYDNSPDNQPIVNGVKQEPQRVTSGEKSAQELCLHYVWLRMDRKKFLGY